MYNIIDHFNTIANKAIVIHCDEQHKADNILNCIMSVKFENPFSNYGARTCIKLKKQVNNIFSSSNDYEYCKIDYYIDNGYTVIEYEDFINGDFYVINNKAIQIKEESNIKLREFINSVYARKFI